MIEERFLEVQSSVLVGVGGLNVGTKGRSIMVSIRNNRDMVRNIRDWFGTVAYRINMEES